MNRGKALRLSLPPKLLAHKPALNAHLRSRWQDLFAADFEVLLYDLTSTYFESAPPQDESDKRRYGYSRDKRNDCVQVVIALIVTPEGFPLAYEVLPGNTADCTTLRDMLRRIEAQYGKAQRLARGDGPRRRDRHGPHGSQVRAGSEASDGGNVGASLPRDVSVFSIVADLEGRDLDGLRRQWRAHLGGEAPAHLPRWLLMRVRAID